MHRRDTGAACAGGGIVSDWPGDLVVFYRLWTARRRGGAWRLTRTSDSGGFGSAGGQISVHAVGGRSSVAHRFPSGPAMISSTRGTSGARFTRSPSTSPRRGASVPNQIVPAGPFEIVVKKSDVVRATVTEPSIVIRRTA